MNDENSTDILENDVKSSKEGRTGLSRRQMSGVVVTDEDGIILSANAILHDMFGHEDGMLIGEPVGVLMVDGDAFEHPAIMKRFESGSSKNVVGMTREGSGRRKDGSEIEIELAVNEASVDGRRIFIANIRDLSFRRRDEGHKQILSKELRAVLDSTSSGMIMLDSDYNVRHSNLTFREMWELDRLYLSRHPNVSELFKITGLSKLMGPEGMAGLAVEAGRTSDLKLPDGRIIERRVADLPSGGYLLTYYDVTG